MLRAATHAGPKHPFAARRYPRTCQQSGCAGPPKTRPACRRGSGLTEDSSRRTLAAAAMRSWYGCLVGGSRRPSATSARHLATSPCPCLSAAPAGVSPAASSGVTGGAPGTSEA